MPFDPTTASVFDPSSATPAAPPQAGGAQPGQQGGAPAPQDAGGSMLKDAGSMIWTALHSAADTGTFGLADKASAGIGAVLSQATGAPMSYDDAYAKIKANNAANAAANPVSAAVGDVGGMVAGAGGLVKAARLIPGAAGVMDALGASDAPGIMTKLANAGKSAAVSGAGAGAYTAADQAIRSGSVDPNSVAVNAVTGALVGPVVSKIGTAIANGVQSSSTKAISLLAKHIGEDPADLATAFNEFQGATGRTPTMAEIVNMKSTGELKSLMNKNPITQAAVNTGADAADAQRPMALSQIIEDSGGGAQDVNQLTQARKTRMTAAMDPIRDGDVDIDGNAAALLQDPRTRDAIFKAKDPDLKARVGQAIEDAQDGGVGTLKLNDIDSIRQSLNSERNNLANTQTGRGNSVAASQYGNHIDNITDIATGGDSSHPYQSALDQFANDSNYIRGFKHGAAGKSVGQATDQQLQSALQTAEGQAGHQAGIVTRTSDAAASSPASAVSVADQLASGTGDTAVLRNATGQNAYSTMAAAGQAESRGAANLKQLRSNGSPAQGSDGPGAGQLAKAAVGAVLHGPASIIATATSTIPSFTKASPAVQRQMGRYLADPRMTTQGINLLRRQGASEAELKKFALALSANAGLNTADTLGQ